MIIGRTKARLISELTIDADIDMATHKLTGLGAGAAPGQSLQYQQAIRQAILTAQGDMIYRDGGLAHKLAKGTEGHYLKQGATIPGWAEDLIAALLTTRGDMLYEGASGVARLGKGTEGHYLKQGANDPGWAALPTVRTIAAGSYTGDDAASRQITTGFKCSMVIISASGSYGIFAVLIPDQPHGHGTGSPYHDVTTAIGELHVSDGFTVTNTDSSVFGNKNLNENGVVLYYWAISE